MTKILGQVAIDALEARGISAETAARYGIFTARTDEQFGTIPDPAGNVVAFPFLERGAIVAEKYRAAGKRFWQRPGGRRTFWNSDVLDDPALQDGRAALLITEGEIDALTAIECGYPFVVSVPDGAPPVREDEDPEQLPERPTSDSGGKFEFMWINRDRLGKIKRFIIAADNDRPGRRLAAELVRRIGASRCAFIEYPPSCKDLNDVLMQRGTEAVSSLIANAKAYPVKGLYKLRDYPEAQKLETISTGWWTLDQHLRPFTGEFMVVTGIPSHGKSTWALNLLVNAARNHGWRSAVFSPEMPTVPHLRDKLRRMISGRGSGFAPHIDAFIDDNFVFIDADPHGQVDDDFDLDWIIDKATDAVQRDGVKCLLIDPWNEVEHARGRDESMTDYIGRSIRSLKRFARRYDVAVIVVAHPTKEVGRDGKSRPPTLYDVEGSAHWFNKCDHGVIIDRPNAHADEAVIRIAKCRFDETGEKGEVRMMFDRQSCRFHVLQHTEQAAE